MMFLDTNTVIAIINDRPPAVRNAFERRLADAQQIAVGSIVIHELRYGIAKSRLRSHNEALLRAFIEGPVALAPFDEMDAAVAGELRAQLGKVGTPIGPYDVLIAGQALRHKATLVTANTREFKCVKGLRVEDWTQE